MKLISKKYIGKRKVRDLHIRDNHNFIISDVVIHNCHTYKIGDYLMENINGENGERLLFHTPHNRQAVLDEHIKSKKPTVLLTPSLSEGIDLKGDLSRFQVLVKCLSNDTHLVTNNGFKTYSEINKDEDIIFSLTPSGEMVMRKINGVIIKKYVGKMLEIKHSQLSMCVTPDHRILLTKLRGGNKNFYIKAKNRKLFTERWMIPIIPQPNNILYSRFCERNIKYIELKKNYSNWIDYSGNVWCISTDEGNFLVERDGKLYFTGNCPFPYLGDERITKKMKILPWWYSYITAKTIVQSLGRSIRSEDDWAISYILDGDWSYFYRKEQSIFPIWFREAILTDIEKIMFLF